MLLQRSPDLVIVQFGLNDCYQGLQADDFAGSLEAIARMVIDAGSVPWLVTSCPVQEDDLQGMAEPFYEAIGSIGLRLGAPVAELDRFWLGHAGDLRPRDLYQWDGVHPTDAGHELMARGLLTHLGVTPKQ
jgi:lysophospholipase L1-like esterase